MTVTAGSSITAGIGSTSTTVSKSITSVPAGATIVLGIQNRSNETSVISGISDDVNGSWTLNYVAGPFDTANGTLRAWLAYRNNCAAGTTNVTVTFDGAINSQLAANYIVSDQGAMTYDAASTTLDQTTATNIDSNTVAATGAGGIVGYIATGNSQANPEPTADGAGESRITSGQAGGRSFLFFEANASSGSYGIETTCDSTVAVFMVGAFKEPSSGAIVHKLCGPFGGPFRKLV